MTTDTMTTLGTPSQYDDRVVAALGVIAGPLREAAGQLPDIARRADFDRDLMRAGGRWEPGTADPVEYVPGDVPALRAIPATAAIALMRSITNRVGVAELEESTDLREVVLGILLDPVVLYRARPFFVPGELALAIAGSTAPPRQFLDEVRMPFPVVWVVFGHDLELPEPMRWPRQMADPATDAAFSALGAVVPGSWRHSLYRALYLRGEAITGVVLFAGEDGKGIADHVLWTVAAHPDPEMPPIARMDSQRGSLLGFRSMSLLRPLLDNIAAAVAAAEWRPARDDVPAIGSPGSERWRRSLGRDRAQRALRAGALSGVRVIDLAATQRAAARSTGGGGHARPIEHARRGHYLPVRVARRDESGRIVGDRLGERDVDWSYELRWIPPLVVNQGVTGAPERTSVWRLPNLSGG